MYSGGDAYAASPGSVTARRAGQYWRSVWVFKVILLMLAIGLPVAVLLAWAMN
jgi:hypothetical protein